MLDLDAYHKGQPARVRAKPTRPELYQCSAGKWYDLPRLLVEEETMSVLNVTSLSPETNPDRGRWLQSALRAQCQ